MCRDENKQAKTVADKIKKMLMNLDMTILYADSEIKIRQATMKLYEGQTTKWAQRKFVEAKIDEERFEVYKEDILHLRDEINENLEILLSKHTPRYKQIFIMYFFQDKTYQEIADQTNYSLVAINKIISKLKNDLLTFYVP